MLFPFILSYKYMTHGLYCSMFSPFRFALKNCLVLTGTMFIFQVEIISFTIDGDQWIQSKLLIPDTAIPEFSLKISPDLSYRAYRIGILCTIKTLSKNRMNTLNSWSRINEALRYLANSELNQHQKVLIEQFDSMKPTKVGKKKYSASVLTRAFSYFTISRSLYDRLRDDFQLPSIKTLTNITSRVSHFLMMKSNIQT